LSILFESSLGIITILVIVTIVLVSISLLSLRSTLERLSWAKLKQLLFQGDQINTHARRVKTPKYPRDFSYLRSWDLIYFSDQDTLPRHFGHSSLISKSLNFTFLKFFWIFPCRLEPHQISSTYYYLPFIQPVFRTLFRLTFCMLFCTVGQKVNLLAKNL